MIVQANNFGQPWFPLFTSGPDLPVNPNKGHIHVTAETYRFGEVVYSQNEPSDHTKFWCKTTVSNDYAILGQIWRGNTADDADFSRIEFGCSGVYSWDGEQWARIDASIWTGSAWKPIAAAPTVIDLSNWVLTTRVKNWGTGSYANGVLTVKGEVPSGADETYYWTSYTAHDMIDLTACSEVRAHIISVASSGWLYAGPTRGDKSQSAWYWLKNINTKVALSRTNNGTDVSLDVSELSGQYYIGFVVAERNEIKSNKVWLS